ncbi:formin-like protein 20 isoform X3 [Anoplophora glabripennis]|uniref:formin-like protein 20 isoform X3 n=1 Tax=Anoplophora glabripennis TaxID=217634 RepID=UPI000873B532|nr:formin-like protein 20 isoform X3 [Anoplophora glabripennis]
MPLFFRIWGTHTTDWTSDEGFYNLLYTVGIFVLGLLILVILTLYFKLVFHCIEKHRRKNGRVIAQPPPQEPVKPSPPPYNPNDYDNPPPYNACVPEELHQQQYGAASQQMSDPNCFAATAPPPKYFPPAPTHVVNIPENTARY